MRAARIREAMSKGHAGDSVYINYVSSLEHKVVDVVQLPRHAALWRGRVWSSPLTVYKNRVTPCYPHAVHAEHILASLGYPEANGGYHAAGHPLTVDIVAHVDVPNRRAPTICHQYRHTPFETSLVTPRIVVIRFIGRGLVVLVGAILADAGTRSNRLLCSGFVVLHSRI